MFIKQLSVFVENREGCLDEVLGILTQQDINIISLSLADTSDYGLLRLIVNKPEQGRDALKENGFSAMLTDIIAVKLAHRVGKLQELLGAICKGGINIEYMYALSTGTTDASIALKTADPQKAAQILKELGIEFFTPEELSAM